MSEITSKRGHKFRIEDRVRLAVTLPNADPKIALIKGQIGTVRRGVTGTWGVSFDGGQPNTVALYRRVDEKIVRVIDCVEPLKKAGSK